MRSRQVAVLVCFAASAAGYTTAAWAGLWLRSPSASIAVFWPASGVGLAALIVSRRWGRPAVAAAVLGIVAANLGSNIAAGNPWERCVGFTAANTVESCVAFVAFLFARRRFPAGPRDLGAVALAAGCGVLVSTPVALLLLSPLIHEPAWRIALNWAIPDATGMLIVLPVVILPGSPLRRPAERAAHLVTLSAVAVLTFWETTGLPIAWVMLTGLVWSAVRLGSRWTMSCVLGLSFWVALATASGRGPFGASPGDWPLLLAAQGYLASLSLTSWRLAASIEEARRAGEALDARAAELGQANAALRHRETLLTSLADSFPGWVAVWDQDARCLLSSSSYLEWFGLLPDQMQGMHISQVHGSQVYPQTRPHVEAALRGQAQRFERSLTRPDGRVGHVIASYVPQFVDGSPSGFFATVTDITTVKEAQLQLEAAIAELSTERVRVESGRQMFQRLFDHSPDAVLLLDADHRIVQANQASTGLFGRGIADLVGQRLDGLIAATVPAGGPASSGAGPSRILHADGHLVAVDLRLGELIEGAAGRTVATLRDMSDAVARAEELARSNAELQQFAYAASHDLQEPLRKVACYVEILGEDYADQLDDQAREYIRYASDGARRMRRLIDDLLAVSRVRVDLMTVGQCDTAAIVAEVLSDLELAIADAGAVIEVGELPTIAADPAHLRQVFHNLLSNAVKYHGDDAPLIQVSAARQGGDWRFTVQDNGIGFSQEYAEKIFRSFTRLVSRESYEGTGIGLSIVAKVIANHGGRVWATSQPGAGSTFQFVLPAAATRVPAPR